MWRAFEAKPDRSGPRQPAETGLSGRLLVATPTVHDSRFTRALIYLCAYGPRGAMGFVVNKPYRRLTMSTLFEQLDLSACSDLTKAPVGAGGPVEPTRGFVLHSTDYRIDGTIPVDTAVAVTANLDILRDIAAGEGPRDSLMLLGYAGWGPGQLDRELRDNTWLLCDAAPSLLFDADLSTRWDRAFAHLGIDPLLLSPIAGRA